MAKQRRTIGMNKALLLMACLLLLPGAATKGNAARQSETGTAPQQESKARPAARTGAAGPAEKTLVICGSGDSQNLLRQLAKAYEQSHAGVHLDVPDSIGSGGGIKAVAAGKCDLGRVARPLKKKEQDLRLAYLLFADSPVVFAVNSSVRGISSISSGQVVGIFSGAITRWSEIGGPPEKIYVANREKGDSSRTIIEKQLPGFAAIDKPVGQILYTTQENVAAINRYKHTIGYASLSEAGNQPNLVLLRLDNVAPDRENVRRKRYKLVAPFGLVWKDPPDQEVKNFIDFLYSPAAEKIMADHGVFSALRKREHHDSTSP
ncbi:MAG: phosphate ABC transporter substrate-binding protein [Desulfurivibrio sp.]|nr:MAG: phosphate ABC transporter substrate-binding protein [Desulfurivibrio sp.]